MHEPATAAATDQTAFAKDIAGALDALRTGDITAAASVATRLALAAPDRADVARLECEVALASGRPEQALAAIDRARQLDPGDGISAIRRADVLLQMRLRSQAREAALAARDLVANDARALWALGRILARCGDPAQAAELYTQASATIDEPALLYDLGTSQFFAGASDEAEAAFDRMLSMAPSIGHGAYLRSVVRRQLPASNHVEAIRDVLASQTLPDRGRAGYLYALAKELEDLGEHAESFKALQEGASLVRSSLRYDAAQECETIDAIGATFTREVLERMGPGWEERGAVFVLGMPRTGTTLLERQLALHGGVVSAGELPDFGDELRSAALARDTAAGTTLVEAAKEIDYAALGRNYMTSAREAAAGAATFVDKMPINFMYCGLIAKALPQARIVHVTRDPMDTCYAIYKTLFANAYPFSYDLGEIARYYATYHRLMRHWQRVLPGRILDVAYESLVSDPVGVTRQVVDWCGVPWRDATSDDALHRASMTASAAQVRQPVHTASIGLWKRHEQELEPLRAELAALGVPV